MSEVRVQLVGAAGRILLLTLPSQVVDETSDAIREAVRDGLPNADGAGLVLDAGSVDLMNSIGITCLLQVQDLCRRRGAPMALARVPEPIATLLRQVRLDGRFESYPSPEEAVAALDGDRG